MKIVSILIATLSLIAFADAHAVLTDPVARSDLAVNQYSGGYQNMWYYRGNKIKSLFLKYFN